MTAGSRCGLTPLRHLGTGPSVGRCGRAGGRGGPAVGPLRRRAPRQPCYTAEQRKRTLLLLQTGKRLASRDFWT